MTKTSLFGKGFIGTELISKFKSSFVEIPRNSVIPETHKIINFRSTLHNYNIYKDPFIDVETNILHLLKILEGARLRFGEDVEFNLISTWGVYGSCMLPAHEDTSCNPKGFYSLTKKLSEDLLMSYCNTYNIKYRILRLANVLGPDDKKVSQQKNALQWLIKKILVGDDIPLYYDGDFFRDYIDVRDCVRAINLVLEDGNHNSIYNISNGKAIKFKDVIEYAIETSNSSSKIVDFDDTKFHEQVQVKSMYLSNHKLSKLGYLPKYSIEKTLRWIINEYRNNS